MVVIHGVSLTPRFTLPSRPLNTGFNAGNSTLSFFFKKHPLSRKIFAGKQSAEFDSSSQAISASEKVLVPDNLDDDPRGFSQVDIFCHLCSLISELYTMHRQIVRG